MRIEIKNSPENNTKKRMFLKAEAILNYLEGGNEKLDTLIMCKSCEILLTTTDQSLYEALGAVEDKKNIDYNKLVKLIEVTDIVSQKINLRKEKTILTEARVKELQSALKKQKQSKGGTHD